MPHPPAFAEQSANPPARRRLGLGLLGWIILCLPPGLIWAHGVDYPRYDRLTIGVNTVQVDATLDLEAGEKSRQLRQRFDANRNGKLEAGEAQYLIQYLQLSTLRLAQLKVDGAKIQPDADKKSCTVTPLDEPTHSGRALRAVGHQIWSYHLKKEGGLMAYTNRHANGTTPLWVEINAAGPHPLIGMWITPSPHTGPGLPPGPNLATGEKRPLELKSGAWLYLQWGPVDGPSAPPID